MQFHQFDWNSKARIAQLLASRIPSYPDEARERLVSEIESINLKFRESMNRFLRNLAVDIEFRSPSLASVSELRRCFLEPNQRVVQLMLASEDAIFTNPDLFDMVTGYLDSSELTFDVCNALSCSLFRARGSLFMIRDALRQFKQVKNGDRKVMYESTLRQLRTIKASGNGFNPFRVGFSELLERDCKKIEFFFSLFVTLKDKKSKLDSKCKYSKAWLALSNAIVLATFASVVVYSVLVAPRLVAGLAEAAATMPFLSMDEWIDSVWKKCEEGERELMMSRLYFRNRIWQVDLDNIGALVDKWGVEMESMLLDDGLDSRDEWIISAWNKYEDELKMSTTSCFWTPIGRGDSDEILGLVDKWDVEIDSVLQNEGFASRDETAAMLAMDDLKKKFSEFMETFEDSNEHAIHCSKDVIDWRLKFTRMISSRCSGE